MSMSEGVPIAIAAANGRSPAIAISYETSILGASRESFGTPVLWCSQSFAHELCHDLFRDRFIADLRARIEHRSSSKKDFWRTFDAFENFEVGSATDNKSSSTQPPLILFSLKGGVGKLLAPYRKAPGGSFVSDGQHRIAVVPKFQRDLSARSIRFIRNIVLKEIDDLNGPDTVAAIILRVRETLIRQVRRRIRWRKVEAAPPSLDVPPSTRDLVLTFALRTGNPPPALGASCPAVGWARVFITAAQKVGHEPVRRRSNPTSLRNPLQRGSARTRVRRSARSYSRLAGGLQFAGRRSAWSDYSLAQCA